ncbi:MAG: hypothetical protein AAFV85_14050 [Cyanobacteria bacterium J06634_6]
MPELTPLTRLNVTDSLRINADRWSLAHTYHRQRQNIHYQSLYQPGIVYGLGVKVIDPPQSAHEDFRGDSTCWVEIQPGLAINGEGNPIVVERQQTRQNRIYPISISQPVQADYLIHLVVRYVDPADLAIADAEDRVLERFRIDQRVHFQMRNSPQRPSALQPEDIELCRIALSEGRVQISQPPDPLNPQPNQLDFRYRPCARLRSQHSVTVGLYDVHNRVKGFQALANAVPHVYPAMQVSVNQIQLESHQSPQQGLPDLICCDISVLSQPSNSQQERTIQQLKSFLETGAGCLLIMCPDNDQKTLTIAEELSRLSRELPQHTVPKEHKLRSQPFLFSAFPRPMGKSVDLYYERGLFVLAGELVKHWSGDNLTRSHIREVHEWGINLLYYVCQYQHYASMNNFESSG